MSPGPLHILHCPSPCPSTKAGAQGTGFLISVRSPLGKTSINERAPILEQYLLTPSSDEVAAGVEALVATSV
jgi:hypothetical protein